MPGHNPSASCSPDMRIHRREIRKPSSMEYGTSVGAYRSRIKNIWPTTPGRRHNADGTKPRRTKPLRLETGRAGLMPYFFASRLAAITMPSPRRPPRPTPDAPPAWDRARFRNWRRRNLRQCAKCGCLRALIAADTATASSAAVHSELFTGRVCQTRMTFAVPPSTGLDCSPDC